MQTHDIYHETLVITEAFLDPDGLYASMLATALEPEDFVDPDLRDLASEIKRRVDARLYTGLVGFRGYLCEWNRKNPTRAGELAERIIPVALMPAISSTQYEAALRILRIHRRRREALDEGKGRIETLGGVAVEQVKPEMDGIAERFTDLASDLTGIPAMAQIREVVDDVYREIIAGPERAAEGRVYCGIPQIDECVGGFDRGRYVIIGARPSVGKSSFATGICWHAGRRGTKTYYVGIEGGRRAVTHRLLALESGVSIDDIRKSRTSQTQRDLLRQAADRVGEMSIEINDDPRVTTAVIRSRASRLKDADGVDLIIVDYLQQLTMPAAETRERQVAMASQDFQRLATELDCVVIVLAQLNRETAKNANDLPMLAHLRESGSLEQDADLVLLLHRPAAMDPKLDPTVGTCRVAKSRYGRVGDVAIEFEPRLSTFHVERGNQ